MSRSQVSRSLLRRGIIRLSLIISLVSMEDRVVVMEDTREDRVDRVDMEAVREGMEGRHSMVDHQAATVVDSTREEVMVGSTEVHHQDKVVMEDIREVTKDHLVVTHHREEIRELTQDIKAVTQHTRICFASQVMAGVEREIDTGIRKRVQHTIHSLIKQGMQVLGGEVF